MRLGGGRMGKGRRKVFVVCQRSAQRTRRVRLQKNCSISSYYRELRRIIQPRDIDCDCLHRYLPSGQIRAITRTYCSDISSYLN